MLCSNAHKTEKERVRLQAGTEGFAKGVEACQEEIAAQNKQAERMHDEVRAGRLALEAQRVLTAQVAPHPHFLPSSSKFAAVAVRPHPAEMRSLSKGVFSVVLLFKRAVLPSVPTVRSFWAAMLTR